MRQVEESHQWVAIERARHSAPSRPIYIGDHATLDLATPCTVLGGRNGAGKSRALRLLAESLAGEGVFIDLHHLCEQALIVLRSREDFRDMAEEFGVIGPDDDRLEDVERVVGRDYDSVDWYALEIEPADDAVAQRFCWAGEQPMVPFFDVKHKGRAYTSREMGLGEFSVHFVFWILEQYRDQHGLILLLDEPDAYLPPIGVSAFLSRLLRLCLTRNWSMVVSTHSEEVINQALEHEAFVLLQAGPDGEVLATHSAEDPRVAEHLLARPAVRVVMFCEDESAYHLTRSLLDAVDRSLSRVASIVWQNGDGYLRTLHDTIPRIARPEISFCFVFDGDQRDSLPAPGEKHWAAVALPTHQDPDSMFKELGSVPEKLASKLDVPEQEFIRLLDTLGGKEPHDWVNDLAGEYGRQRVLRVLADLWCEENTQQVNAFAEDIKILDIV